MAGSVGPYVVSNTDRSGRDQHDLRDTRSERAPPVANMVRAIPFHPSPVATIAQARIKINGIRIKTLKRSPNNIPAKAPMMRKSIIVVPVFPNNKMGFLLFCSQLRGGTENDTSTCSDTALRVLGPYPSDTRASDRSRLKLQALGQCRHRRGAWRELGPTCRGTYKKRTARTQPLPRRCAPQRGCRRSRLRLLGSRLGTHSTSRVKAATERAIVEATGLAGQVTCRCTHGLYPDGPAPYFTFNAAGRHGELNVAVARHQVGRPRSRDRRTAARSLTITRSGATIGSGTIASVLTCSPLPLRPPRQPWIRRACSIQGC